MQAQTNTPSGESLARSIGPQPSCKSVASGEAPKQAHTDVPREPADAVHATVTPHLNFTCSLSHWLDSAQSWRQEIVPCKRGDK